MKLKDGPLFICISNIFMSSKKRSTDLLPIYKSLLIAGHDVIDKNELVYLPNKKKKIKRSEVEALLKLSKVQAIKVLREKDSTLSLKDAKEMVEYLQDEDEYGCNEKLGSKDNDNDKI